nr:metallophosphoesterase [Phytoactinopolyspora limicola]
MFAKKMTLGLTGLALGGLVYAAGYEVRSFRLRRFEVPVLPSGTRPIRVLHVSDLHLTPKQRGKIEWVRGLAALQPDIVVDTGDNLAHSDAVPAVLDAFEPLLSTPGVFVFGSNDYYKPQPKNPAAYLLPTRGKARVHQPNLPWADLQEGFSTAGWLDLTNTRGTVDLGDLRLDFVGVDDPHLGRDRYDRVAGPASPEADLTVGVTHAPYLRVLDAMAGDGCQLLLAGHTHGGQLCVPGYGALVTNCDLEPARVKGVSRHPAEGGPGAAWMHVSAGLGTSPYTPVRFACPPEATLLTLVAAP